MQKIKKQFVKLLKQFFSMLPMIWAILLIISMLKFTAFFDYIEKLPNNFFGAFIADIIWSISASSPINAYIIASSISWQDKILVVVAFLVAWSTVGMVQFPMEVAILWKKFAIKRNLVNFVFALIVAYVVYLLCKFFWC